jgi:DNA-binding protein HU-beta
MNLHFSLYPAWTGTCRNSKTAYYLSTLIENVNLKFARMPAVCNICKRFYHSLLKTKHMNKAELIDAMATETGLTKADSKRALDSFIANTAKTLKKGDSLVLIGFGTFKVAQRAARNGRNPQTGKVIKIKAKKVVKFKAGADLSKKVSGAK